MEVFVFMPEDTPRINQVEAHLCGAKVFLVNGLITDCGRLVREGTPRLGWFDVSTLKEPYRLEGKKTMGLELFEQLGRRLPDVILYPTGGGVGLIGIHKALRAAVGERARGEGAFVCPGGAATLAAARRLRESGWLDSGDEVLLLNT